MSEREDTVTARITVERTVVLLDGASVTFGTRSLARSGNNIIASLPTSDPGVAGALYNDSGTLKISAG